MQVHINVIPQGGGATFGSWWRNYPTLWCSNILFVVIKVDGERRQGIQNAPLVTLTASNALLVGILTASNAPMILTASNAILMGFWQPAIPYWWGIWHPTMSFWLGFWQPLMGFWQPASYALLVGILTTSNALLVVILTPFSHSSLPILTLLWGITLIIVLTLWCLVIWCTEKQNNIVIAVYLDVHCIMYVLWRIIFLCIELGSSIILQEISSNIFSHHILP